MSDTPAGASIPEVTHHTVEIDETELHYVEAGTEGTPILLVHGFPESWWAFHRLIPALAEKHRVFAVDLRGFGDSGGAADEADSARHAEDLHELIAHLDIGPVHLSSQDISGPAAVRLALSHPEDVRSFTGIETGLPGFGWEAVADVTHGGAWHVGTIAAPGIAEMLIAGREREFLGEYAFPSMQSELPGEDLDEFVRVYSRPHGFGGTSGLYRSMLGEGDGMKDLVAERKLKAPTLAIGSMTGSFTAKTLGAVTDGEVKEASLEGTGHCVALVAPDALAKELLDFVARIDS